MPGDRSFPKSNFLSTEEKAGETLFQHSKEVLSEKKKEREKKKKREKEKEIYHKQLILACNMTRGNTLHAARQSWGLNTRKLQTQPLHFPLQ